MAKRKQTPNTPGEQIAQQILSHYDLKDAQDVQNVMKQIFGPIFESMLKGGMKNLSATKRMSALPAATMHAMAIRKKRSKHRWARFQSAFPATVRAPLNRR